MYKKVFDPVTQRDVLKWVYVPSQDPGEVKARQEREAWGNRMIYATRNALRKTYRSRRDKLSALLHFFRGVI